MTRPLFLSIDDVTKIHDDQIQRYGGSLGIRDVELLHSALGMPEAGFGDQYLHAGLLPVRVRRHMKNGYRQDLPSPQTARRDAVV